MRWRHLTFVLLCVKSWKSTSKFIMMSDRFYADGYNFFLLLIINGEVDGEKSEK